MRALARPRPDTVVIVGVHRAELDFGDRVSALLDPDTTDVLRIPAGIEQPRTAPHARFRSRARHREIYLQLRQQIRHRYDLAIDVHCGYDEQGHAADIFCHDLRFLDCLASRVAGNSHPGPVRLIRIIGDDEPTARPDDQGSVQASARTWIPQRVWLDVHPLYVGLEVYLVAEAAGDHDDWTFAKRLIDAIRDCHVDRGRG